jgi:flagellar hook-associated protein 3 FlgL
MRVPTNSNTSQMLDQIQTLNARQSKLQTQVASGQRIFQPEDDPAAVGRILTMDTERGQLEQFNNNVDRALGVAQASFSGLQNIKQISDRAGELATLGASATDPSALSAYAAEVDQLLQQAVQLANAKQGNDYLYAGNKLDTAPFVTVPPTGNPITAVSYVGSTVASDVPTVKISESASVTPGTTVQTNQDIAGFLQHLITLRDTLKSGGNLDAVRTQLTTDEDSIVNALSENGAIQTRIEISQTQNQDRLTTLERLVSSEADVDLPETITRLNQASVAYQAALQSSAQLMRTSLLDYLK